MPSTEAQKRASRNFRATHRDTVKDYNSSYYQRNRETLKAKRRERYRLQKIEKEAKSNMEDVLNEIKERQLRKRCHRQILKLMVLQEYIEKRIERMELHLEHMDSEIDAEPYFDKLDSLTSEIDDMEKFIVSRNIRLLSSKPKIV
jgi:hypothetical protein